MRGSRDGHEKESREGHDRVMTGSWQGHGRVMAGS